MHHFRLYPSHARFYTTETLLVKAAWKKFLSQAGRRVKHYHTDNGRFSDNGFLFAVNSKYQKITFCGIGAHHKIGIVEDKNKIINQGSRTILLNGMCMWPQIINQMFCQFAFKDIAEMLNTLQVKIDGSTPE